MISFILVMNTEILKNRNKDLLLGDGDVTTLEILTSQKSVHSKIVKFRVKWFGGITVIDSNR